MEPNTKVILKMTGGTDGESKCGLTVNDMKENGHRIKFMVGFYISDISEEALKDLHASSCLLYPTHRCFLKPYPSLLYTQQTTSGSGRWSYPDGSYYEGSFIEGHRHNGLYSSADQSEQYKGDFNQYDQRHGIGTFFFSGGKKDDTGIVTLGFRYDGDWKEDYMHGTGRIEYADGCLFEGTFSRGKREGKGRFLAATVDNEGEGYSGEWKDDLKHGQVGGFCIER